MLPTDHNGQVLRGDLACRGSTYSALVWTARCYFFLSFSVQNAW